MSAAATGAWFYVRRNPAPLSLFKIGEKRWASLSGTLAATLAIFSAALGGWILTHGIPNPEHLEVRRQVIDIILVSPHDYQNNHDILPSTAPSASQPKELTVQAKPTVVVPAVKPNPEQKSATEATTIKASTALTSTSKAQPVAAASATHEQRSTTSSAKSRTLSTNPQAPPRDSAPEPSMVLRQPSPAPPPTAAPAVAPGLRVAHVVQHKAEHSQPVLEEVAGAQMFEVTDTQSDRASEVAQNGGHSSGGNGAQNLLNLYLREVHRRIKKAWIPGTDDTTSSAQIVFRIRKNGRLVSMKLLRSSGSPETDESAMHAVTASAPFKPLPADFPAESLDLMYTFNYKVDELSEVPPPQLE